MEKWMIISLVFVSLKVRVKDWKKGLITGRPPLRLLWFPNFVT